MADTAKILGQVATSATTETALYTVPSATTTVVSSLYVVNRGTASTSFRISCSVASAATATKDYLYYDVPIGANDTFVATVGLSLGASDIIRVYAGNANLSFTAFGLETS